MLLITEYDLLDITSTRYSDTIIEDYQKSPFTTSKLITHYAIFVFIPSSTLTDVGLFSTLKGYLSYNDNESILYLIMLDGFQTNEISKIKDKKLLRVRMRNLIVFYQGSIYGFLRGFPEPYDSFDVCYYSK